MFLIKMLENYDVQYHDFMLKHITIDLDSFAISEIGDNLKVLYKEKDANKRMMTSILNSIFTHRMQTFMMTKRSLAQLLKNDPNQHYNGVSGTSWGSVRNAMQDLGQFQELRKPTNGKAGVYKLIYQPAIDVLYQLHDLHVESNKSANWFPHMENKLIEYWDANEKEPENKRKYTMEAFEQWEKEQDGKES